MVVSILVFPGSPQLSLLRVGPCAIGALSLIAGISEIIRFTAKFPVHPLSFDL